MVKNYFPFERQKVWPGEPIVIKESLMACEGKDIQIVITLCVSSTFKLYACNLQAATTEVKNKAKNPQPFQNSQTFVIEILGFLG